MDYKAFKQLKNLRPVARNELVLDCDHYQHDYQHGDLGIRRLAMMFSVAGYRIEIYKAEGQKSYHAHIKDIPHIAELPKEQNKLYKELLIKKYIAQVKELIQAPELDYIDFTLCIPDHLIAEENKPHFKYKTIKELVAIINRGNQNFCEPDIINQIKTQQQGYKPQIQGTGITAEITKRLSIVDLARKLGLEVDSRGFALCPFHPDSKPSLKFYEEQGRFCCFGCQTKGNIIYFYALMKKLQQVKNEN